VDAKGRVTAAANGSGASGLPTSDYDSGWFAVAGSTNYTKTHSLGVTPRLVIVQHSLVASPGGSDELVMVASTETYNNLYGVGWGATATAVLVTTRGTVLTNPRRNSSSGYLRILAWK
jgi:hypothetical protein